MSFSNEQEKQLNILDEYLRYMDLDKLDRHTNEVKVVEKLKDNDPAAPSLLLALVERIDILETTNNELNRRITTLTNDIRSLTIIARTEQKAANENADSLNSLCSKHSVW